MKVWDIYKRHYFKATLSYNIQQIIQTRKGSPRFVLLSKGKIDLGKFLEIRPTKTLSSMTEKYGSKNSSS